MRANTHHLLALALLTLTTALPDRLVKRQAVSTTTTTAGTPTGAPPTSTAPIDPTLTGPTSTGSITTIPPTDTATITLTPNPTLTVTGEEEEEEDCTTTTAAATGDGWDDTWIDVDIPAGHTNGTAPAATHCPGEEICHPKGGEGEAPPPGGPAGTGPDKPVAPYTGGAGARGAVGRGFGALVGLAVVGAWVL